MRKLIRTPEPEVLKLKAAQWNEQWKNLRQKNASAQFAWYEHEKKSAREWILTELRDMANEHCSFCDGFPVGATSLEPIEHFRPKHDPRFHHLAFEWSNLYYCCDRCQGEKSSQWDDALIAPDEENYRLEDYFEYDLGSGEIRANRFASEDRKRRANTTIQIFGLNGGGRPTRRRKTLAKWLLSSLKDIHDEPYRDFIECGSLTAVQQANGLTISE